ncbi:MAG TPA: YwiC-like family protein [Anaeromyxobacteraceae bacterium]|nr:YwiC-like family protein [Anaeromyxobacteraceae bacterium]
MTDRPRSLFPKEHGAYGQLLLPLVTALAVSRPTVSSALLTLASLTAFGAHEPLLVLAGLRGKRPAEEDAPRSRALLARLAGFTAAFGLAGVALAPPAARLALAAPVALGGAVMVLVARRLEKSALGEVTVGAALSSCGLPVALAGGASPGAALACWLTWILAFAAATLAVQVILVRARSKGARDPGALYALLTALLAGAAAAAAAARLLPWAVPVALAPTALASLAVCLARVPPKRLRELGWAMIGTTTLTMALLLAGLR